jgi:hypothetical protein
MIVNCPSVIILVASELIISEIKGGVQDGSNEYVSARYQNTCCDVQMWFAPGFSDPDKYRWDSWLFVEG